MHQGCEAFALSVPLPKNGKSTGLEPLLSRVLQGTRSRDKRLEWRRMKGQKKAGLRPLGNQVLVKVLLFIRHMRVNELGMSSWGRLPC